MFTFRISDEIELRLFELRYADELFRMVDKNREYLSVWLPWVESSKNVENTKEFIQFGLNRFAQNNGFSSGIFYNDRLVGSIGFHEIDWNHKKTSIGYWLGEEYQGLGIMTRACKGLIQHAFNELGLNRVEIRACTGNEKSRAIPERLGFELEGTNRQAELLHNRFHDHVVYGMLAEDFQEHQ